MRPPWHPVVGLVACLLAAGSGPAAPRADEPRDAVDRFETFLVERGIDKDRRGPLEAAGPWDDAKQRAAIRVLARLGAPAGLALRWQAEAAETAAAAVTVGDRLVRIRGRATFVAALPLPPDQADLAGRPALDVVRIVDPAGTAVDVLTTRCPAAWPRWRPVDEPAVVVGLPLSTAAGPRPDDPRVGAGWPEAPAAAILAATGVAWEPDTSLGRLGMDYGLFDTVVDGGRLQPGDTEAFYGLLAASGRAEAGEIEAAAGPTTDIVPLINPAAGWFATNRGCPVTVAGTARKATRIAIDEPVRRQQVGADHYWEVFVFVDTPPLRVDGREQDTYPVVCCVRSLPAGMPTGDAISERVTLSGFALKRYGYPLADVTIVSSQGDATERGRRMEAPLVVGRTAAWQPAASPGREGGSLFWVCGGLAAAVLALLAARNWSVTRQARRDAAAVRARLPEHFALPPVSQPPEDLQA